VRKGTTSFKGNENTWFHSHRGNAFRAAGDLRNCLRGKWGPRMGGKATGGKQPQGSSQHTSEWVLNRSIGLQWKAQSGPSDDETVHRRRRGQYGGGILKLRRGRNQPLRGRADSPIRIDLKLGEKRWDSGLLNLWGVGNPAGACL